jgi:hypothetical protein
LAIKLGGGYLIIIINWKILIFIDSDSCGLNVGFPLVEGTRALDGLKEVEVLWPANCWIVLRKLV